MVLRAKVVMAGPESKVGLEREMLLKQLSEFLMRWLYGFKLLCLLSAISCLYSTTPEEVNSPG